MKDKILFIDDETEILKVYTSIFQRESEAVAREAVLDFLDEPTEETVVEEESFSTHDFEVFTAKSGEEGIDVFLRERDIKVAFIDMRMPPGMNGAETAKKLREFDPRLEIVIVTAYSDINLTEIAKQVGKPDKLLYLKKPFATEEIEQLAVNLVSKYNSVRVKEQFLNNISHEFKTPLSIISGFSQVLYYAALDNGDQESIEHLEVILKNANDLEVLVNDVLLLTEMNQESKSDHLRYTSFYSYIESLRQVTFPLERKFPEVKFHFDVKTDDFNFYCSPRKLKVAIGNILENAFKFTKNGNIYMNISATDDYVTFHIEDDGIGIEESAQKRIFEKFYRIENNSQTDPGLGLGLSSTKSIINLHKGEIKISSAIGVGTTVTVRIPVRNSLNEES